MQRGIWRSVAIAVASLVMASPAVAAHAASDNPTSGSSTEGTVTPTISTDLPSYRQWIADVSVVANLSQQYLTGRLQGSASKTAIVLDIDNTALETGYCALVVYCPATAPILQVARQAKKDGAAVFFVSARPEIFYLATEFNLSNAGYPIDGLYMRPTFNFDPNATMKTAARADIERQGYRIVANIGNSDTDLVGGFAERTFKLPDYGSQLP